MGAATGFAGSRAFFLFEGICSLVPGIFPLGGYAAPGHRFGASFIDVDEWKFSERTEARRAVDLAIPEKTFSSVHFNAQPEGRLLVVVIVRAAFPASILAMAFSSEIQESLPWSRFTLGFT